MVNPKDLSKVLCCAIGSTCGSTCSEQQVECNITATITSAGSTTTSVAATCCGRVCTGTSMYGCPASFGGGCCPYGQVCGVSSLCLSTSAASSSALVSEVPAGCTTSQVACASSLGGGCCANTQACTFINGGAKCVETTTVPTGTGVSAVPQDADAGLGTGAKAGIAVGVVVAAGVVIGALTWWCIRQRRSRSETASDSHPRPGQIVGGGGRAMTETNSDDASRPGGLGGLAHDYFGPNPLVGPYTDVAHTEATSAGTSPGVERGVPLEPHGPGDIAAPVEIDSRVNPLMLTPEGTGSVPNGSPPAVSPIPAPVTTDGRFELYGDDPSPDPNLPSPFTESPLLHSPLDRPPLPLSPQTPEEYQSLVQGHHGPR